MATTVYTGQHRPIDDSLRPAVMTRLRSRQFLAFMTLLPCSIDLHAPLEKAGAVPGKVA